MPAIKYILDAKGKPVACANTQLWGIWHLEMKNRVLVEDYQRGHTIVTMFSGVDLAPKSGESPALWETEVLFRGQQLPEYRKRYRSKSEALAGHKELVESLAASSGPIGGNA